MRPSQSGVVSLLERNKHRNNLLNSSVIELVEHMRAANIRDLIKYFVEKYRHFFEDIHYVDTFTALIARCASFLLHTCGVL